ncbi:hypothetical protein [Fibrobacter sp. UWB7]|uniref:hypothetical protein n=1 Tax=Fibrobacter sp. UWB7 TaxID=1896206 RepID=UPI0009143540|nr:hypothetical protein [Fibrobacter sp. UWB7]SHM93116.1 hypothetical protein SAMN05720467_2771 [Fibrobacter sp. UWB7]
MKKEEFRAWLENAGYDERTINSRIANCSTICSYEGDIDEHYDEDECAELLRRLSYSKDDERAGHPARHSVPIKKNIYDGTATLRSALNRYIEFRNGGAREVRAVAQAARAVVHAARRARPWPDWDMPAEDECYQFAKATTKYLRFLSPEIIEAVVRDNEENRDMFCEYLNEAGIVPELYLWEKSPCCFPGIRRTAGSEEVSALRGHVEMPKFEDAIGIDDNDYPKHLWSFIFRGKQFSKFGPGGYSLAHLVDHKKEKNRMADEFIFSRGHEFQKPFYGLYSCPSNTVYTPTNLIRLTDFNGAIRNMLFRKAESLYKGVCNIVPPYAKIKKNEDPRWDLDKFEWAEPVGTLENMEAFLTDRRKKIEKMLEKIHQKS